LCAQGERKGGHFDLDVNFDFDFELQVNYLFGHLRAGRRAQGEEDGGGQQSRAWHGMACYTYIGMYSYSTAPTDAVSVAITATAKCESTATAPSGCVHPEYASIGNTAYTTHESFSPLAGWHSPSLHSTCVPMYMYIYVYMYIHICTYVSIYISIRRSGDGRPETGNVWK